MSRWTTKATDLKHSIRAVVWVWVPYGFRMVCVMWICVVWDASFCVAVARVVYELVV